MQYVIPQEIIEDYFSEYKSHMIWILTVFAIISVLIQYWQNLNLSKKIEKYKNELRRDEIKFSRFNELQIESLKNLYDHIVTFHFKYIRLVNPPYYTHHSLKINIKSVKEEFLICMEYFHRNRIFLTDELISTIRILHNNFIIIETHLDNQWKDLLNLEENTGSSHPEHIYESASNEVRSIKNDITQLIAKDKVSLFEKDIIQIRDKTEKYFKELTK
jgi:hypothetical protein